MAEYNRPKGASLEERAKAFATYWHGSIGQVRGHSGLPYILHPAAVSGIVRAVTDDEELLAAAWLHDVVEDTPCTLADIETEFGPVVAELVENLTNVSQKSDGSRAVRIAIDRAHTAKASPRAKTVKLADVIDNIGTIHECPRNFALLYTREKRELLKVLKEGHPVLYRRAEEVLRRAHELLGITDELENSDSAA